MKQHLSTIYRLWNLFKPFHKWMYLELFLIFLVQIIYVGFSFTTSKTMNALVDKDSKMILILLVASFLLEVLGSIFGYFQDRINLNKLGIKIQQHIQHYSLNKILSLTIEQHQEEHSAMKLTVISQGEGNIISVLDRITTGVIPSVILLIVSFTTLIFINSFIALIVFCLFIILLVWSYFFSKEQYSFTAKNRDNWNEQSKFRTEAFTHLPLVKTLGREDVFIKQYLGKREEIYPHHMVTNTRMNNHFLKRMLFSDFSSSLIGAISIYFYFNGVYTLGIIYLIANMSGKIFGNIRSLIGAMREIPQSFTHIEKYLDIIDKNPSFSEGGATAVRLDGDIEIKNVSFGYNDSENRVIDNISLIIPNGKITAFVGHSGSGKSTIAKILLRSYDYKEGVIRIGDTDIKNINAQYLRTRIGYVEQHVDLFDDTVKNNILIAVDEDKLVEKELLMEEIGKKTRISEFYHRLGEGKWNTLVGERGLKLSGGERQRIGIARAIIKDPDILIFDEATASLDTINEKFVMDSIHEVSKGKTTIIVAHRLSTVKNADKIVVLDKGKIVAEGTHDELMSNSSHYQELVANQVNNKIDI